MNVNVTKSVWIMCLFQKANLLYSGTELGNSRYDPAPNFCGTVHFLTIFIVPVPYRVYKTSTGTVLVPYRFSGAAAHPYMDV